ncbi:MAG TPA: M48 family metalloprotease [Chthoniobacteraceae bacterium]|jgi:predicted Zn-dependent protease|nr:M48 family metalloprotease [Chthoniobacteraceae bacterium]
MASDFDLKDGAAIGEWLHARIAEAALFEEADWAIERVCRVEDRLQFDRPEAERLVVEIPWLELFTAFTGPGRYIYISRRLFERCATDEHVAFIVAHELAHHDLQHLNLFAGWAEKLIHLPGSDLFAAAFHALESRLYGPEKECDADRHALDLCLAAGYDGARCLGIFDIFEEYALHYGDLDIVHGPDRDSDDELDPDAPWTTKAQIWAWQRKRGYLPIRDRRQMLLNYLAEITTDAESE